LEAYIIGPDYMGWRDDLIKALEQRDVGELIHPYRGILNVALVAPARITESADEGGMARFTLSFIQVDNNTQPSFRPDTPALVNAAADNAKAALGKDFAKKFSIKGLADFVVNGAMAIINGALDFVSYVSNFTNNGPLGELMHAASAISGALATLMSTPAMLASGIQGQIYGLASLRSTPAEAFAAMQSFFSSFSGFDSGLNNSSTPSIPPILLTTPSRIQQQINQSAVIDLVRRTAIVEATRASSQIDFTSYNDAQAALTLLANALDTELLSMTITSTGQAVPISDDVYDALLTLRVAMVRDINARGANLAQLTTITLPSTMPSLVAAYRIYGDCTMEADIVVRNNIRRPGFLPGGIPLEVLS
jgi:prophage DNA circulation protein